VVRTTLDNAPATLALDLVAVTEGYVGDPGNGGGSLLRQKYKSIPRGKEKASCRGLTSTVGPAVVGHVHSQIDFVLVVPAAVAVVVVAAAAAVDDVAVVACVCPDGLRWCPRGQWLSRRAACASKSHRVELVS